jgi:hypothetical protein
MMYSNDYRMRRKPTVTGSVTSTVQNTPLPYDNLNRLTGVSIITLASAIRDGFVRRHRSGSR